MTPHNQKKDKRMIKTYKLAVLGAYGTRRVIGPMMTLEQAERYQADMIAGGFPVVILNMAEGYDPTLKTGGRKVWQRFSLMQV
jgi:hypothetical protein